MASDLYAATDGLSVIIRHLADFEHGGLVLDSEGVCELALQLKAIRVLVKRLEHEVSRHRWNEASRKERATGDLAAMLVSSHLARGGNIVAFPNRTPAFSDGRAEPGEWR